ncbi:uncharacterized protein THITE_2090463 [Thermothielavioides terrestris NRRL 8126]|uniref:Glycine-rich cell wall structural protein 1 n=1 Tax=Thermothielavioides terrestris (strain ATCC 38088 / NRRL 8126) TaxID=578455 RepID=G2RAX9_THETT|nr:uncharacterized protein THITE_2090463 [Thermothielavioides terrestris NRRL 8126]AEO68954.1 hypothetical protein THITE_2090463 [Thermothielavioides terrestris NRRL 8126]
METIHNLTNAASRAIWGDTSAQAQAHEEPVSGKMGNVAAGEPYDAGNIGEPNEAALSSEEQRETETPVSSANEPATGSETGAETTAFPEALTERTKPAAQESKPTSSEDTARESQPRKPAGPAEEAPSAVAMRDDSTKAQSDTRPPAPSPDEAEPRAGTTTTATKDAATTTSTTSSSATDTTGAAGTTGSTDEAKAEAEPKDAAEKKVDKKSAVATATGDDDTASPAIKLEGPGPRPLEEIAREHGGDAGAAKPDSVVRSSQGLAGAGAGASAGAGPEGRAVPDTAGQRRRDSGKSMGGEGEGEGESGLKVGGKGERAGEQHFHSTGLAAEGGDFDASKPGAGKEADRLLEEIGVHRGEGGGHHNAGSSGKEKLGIKDKIKAKLHKSTMSP